MSFIFPAIAIAGLAAMALPLLIHLINMMRHRRVKWAAMDFLLQSYKKHRNYVWLKQLLLLIARMAAVLLLGLLLAGLGCHSQISQWLDSSSTHHYVLLDDSFSMSDNAGGGETAFDRAKRAVERIGARAAGLEGRHEITVLRYSRAGGGASEKGAAVAEEAEGEVKAASRVFRMADVSAEIADEQFRPDWEEISRGIHPAELAVGPQGVLSMVKSLVGQGGEQQNVVYLVSDFRQADWENTTEVRSTLTEIRKAGARIELISCVEMERPNLAIVSLKPEERTQAAGVPLFVTVDVKNFGNEKARNVQLKIRSQFYSQTDEAQGDPTSIEGDAEELPVVLIPEINPGQTETRRVQVYFPAAGRHVIEASIPEDSVAADNRRYAVINFPDGVPVLVVDGDVNQGNAYFANSIFNPSFLQEDDVAEDNVRARSGVKPEQQTAAFLRDATIESLEKYRVIYLLDTPRLDPSAVTVLEEYVKRGGGLCVFAGPNMNLAWYTDQFYREGEGVFPLPLMRDRELAADPESDVPDFEVSDHLIFDSFNTALTRISSINHYIQPPPGWKPEPKSSTRVIATIRNGDPLAVERRFGEGRVAVFLTTMAPQWNNLAQRFTLPIILFNTQSFLESAGRKEPERVAGSDIDLQLESVRFSKDVEFVAPGDGGSREIINREALRPEENSPLMNAALGGKDTDGFRTGETDRSGVYEAWLYALEGSPEVRRYALNVNTAESDLAVSDPKALTQYLEPAEITLVRWDEFIEDPEKQAGANITLLALGLLITLLLGEQALAYSASYHPTRGGVR